MFKEYHSFKIINYNNILQDLDFVNISEGAFMQGSNKNSQPFVFDNELPPFYQNVNKFKISKTVVTNHIYYKFILDGGYLKKELWSHYGWLYIKENKIDFPKYWVSNKYGVKIYFNS